MGVHVYLYSDDVLEVECPQGSGHGPGQRKALCHAVSDADGKFVFKTIPCGKVHASCCLLYGFAISLVQYVDFACPLPLICLNSEDTAYCLYIRMNYQI